MMFKLLYTILIVSLNNIFIKQTLLKNMSGVFEMNMTTILLKSLSQDISIIFCHIKNVFIFQTK